MNEGRDGMVLAIAERQPQSEFARAGQFQLSGKCDVAVGCMIELPVHLEIAGQVGPAIALPNIAARNARERNRGCQCQPCSLTLGNKHRSTRHAYHRAVIAPASNLEMRCAQGVKPQAGEERFVAGESGVLENTGQVRGGDDFLDNGILPGWVRIRTEVSQNVAR